MYNVISSCRFYNLHKIRRLIKAYYRFGQIDHAKEMVASLLIYKGFCYLDPTKVHYHMAEWHPLTCVNNRTLVDFLQRLSL